MSVPILPLNDGGRIPQLGLGVGAMSVAQSVAAIHEAFRAGYRSIDTASLYQNETGVGEAVRSSGLKREEIFITTKLGNDDQGYDRARRAFDASLQRLGLDYVDLYLIHWPLPRRNTYVDSWRALVQLKQEGRARSVGVSNFYVPQLERVISETEVVPAVNQVELHPWLPLRALREFHKKKGIVTEAWSPLARSSLLDNPVIAGLAKKLHRTPAQVILRWNIQSGIVTIPKSVTPSRIRENIAVFNFKLSDEDMAAIGRLESGRRIGPDPETVN